MRSLEKLLCGIAYYVAVTLVTITWIPYDIRIIYLKFLRIISNVLIKECIRQNKKMDDFLDVQDAKNQSK